MTDMHITYGFADGNSRRAARMYQERYANQQVPDHWLFTTLHRKLCENRSFSENRVDAGHPWQFDQDLEDDVLELFSRNPRTVIRALATSMEIQDHTVV